MLITTLFGLTLGQPEYAQYGLATEPAGAQYGLETEPAAVAPAKRGRGISKSPDGTVVTFGICEKGFNGLTYCKGGAPGLDGNKAPLGGSIAVSHTTHPDGSWETETTVTHANGLTETSWAWGSAGTTPGGRRRSIETHEDGTTVEYGDCERDFNGNVNCKGGAGVDPEMAPLGGSVSKTLTTYPDGSWKTETKVTRADGSWESSSAWGSAGTTPGGRRRVVTTLEDGSTVEYGDCTRRLDGAVTCKGGAGVDPEMAPLGGSVSKTKTYRPDGTVEYEITVTHADGTWETQHGMDMPTKLGRSAEEWDGRWPGFLKRADMLDPFGVDIFNVLEDKPWPWTGRRLETPEELLAPVTAQQE